MVLLLVDMVWLFHCNFTLRSKRGLEFYNIHATAIEPYLRTVKFFRTFNIAWIFSWECRFHNYLLNTFAISIVRLYKVKWWNEFRTKLCCKESVEFFCKTKTKKYTLHNLHTLETKKMAIIGPSTPVKNDSSSSSTKTQSKGLSQKERDI